MSDWLGLLLFVLFGVGIYAGLKILSRPRRRTEAEFEKGAAESVSLAGASMNALHEILDPAEARAKTVKVEMKDGRYLKKKREGKANDEDLSEENYD